MWPVNLKMLSLECFSIYYLLADFVVKLVLIDGVDRTRTNQIDAT